MRHRCDNPMCKDFPRYGGRGIRVCDRWRSFEAFYADMGDRPEGTSLDRIDSNGDYEPGNCRWADRPTQNNNRRVTRLLTIGAVTRPLSDWSRDAGLPNRVVSHRLDRGWEPRRALGLDQEVSIG